jgi:hypothetical protein
MPDYRYAARPRAGSFVSTVPAEPARKRAVLFVDGQNLFHAAREAFSYTYPNYDIVAWGARSVTRRTGFSRRDSVLHGDPPMTLTGTSSGARSSR